MATIREVARLAEVSVTTVSHVINQTRFVSEAARKRVEAAIAELAYVPSAVARSLKHQQTHTFGMVIPNNSNPYFAEILRGVEERSFAAGYNVILGNSQDDPARQADYLRLLAAKRVDGLILVACGKDTDVFAALGQRSIPLVLVDRDVAGLNADLVETDHQAGGEMAARHLLQAGHRHLACIAGPESLLSSQERLAGWYRGLQSAGLQGSESACEYADFSMEGGYQAMQRLLQWPIRPSAVFACNDLMALGAQAALRDAGLRVPEDVSLLGFDDIQLASYTSPPLTSIAQPKNRIGQLAAQMLLEKIRYQRQEVRRVLLAPELISRASVALYSENREEA